MIRTLKAGDIVWTMGYAIVSASDKVPLRAKVICIYNGFPDIRVGESRWTTCVRDLFRSKNAAVNNTLKDEKKALEYFKNEVVLSQKEIDRLESLKEDK